MPEDDVETTDSEANTETESVEEATDESGDNEQTQTTPDFKSKWEGQRKVNRDLERKLAEANQKIADFGKTAEEVEAQRAQRDVEVAALAKANDRILRSEIRAAATGKLADPADAVLFLNLDDFTVTEEGSVDNDAIEEAISDLLTRKPHLAAKAEKRFGNVNQNPKAPAKPGQLSRAEYNALSREDRRKARDEGRVNNILGAN
ncbi:hypothetical protein [Microbacterium jejuense]|uniref:hypothetical protein n=1 Tax=Microbacterium jejuense TaxID=1263637 RepID=UPI0031E60432